MRASVLAALLVAAAGCGADFTPRSVLFDLRVLAIRATPLEAGPDESVTLDAVRVPPPGGDVAREEWRFCPFSVGSTAGYACAAPACEVALPPSGEIPLDPSGEPSRYVSAPVTANPGALARDCLALLSGSGALPPDVPPDLPESVEVLFKYVAEGTDGSSRESVQRLRVYPRGAPADRNVAPVIASVEIGGTPVAPVGTAAGPDPVLRPGAELEVRVLLTPESAQPYVEGGRALTESLVVSFYTTAGRFDFDFADGPDAGVALKGEELAAGTIEALVWAVARDLRGGQTVAGPFRVAVAP